MIFKISGLTRREVLLTKTEAKLVQDLLNNLHWENCKQHPKLMRVAMQALNKLGNLTYAPTKAKEARL